MNDDALKVVVFGGALVAVYLIARFARGISDQANSASRIEPPEHVILELEKPMRPPPALVGHELPFPFDIRELDSKYGTGYWRPNILNYYFGQTDLVTGPSDPDDFHDQFFVEVENPEDGYRWIDSFDVVTPKGLARVMKEDGSDFVYGTGTIIVPRYHLETILRAVLEHYVGNEILRRQQEKVEGPSDN